MDSKELLEGLSLPELQDRESMKKILLENEYGYMPEIAYEVAVSEPKNLEGRYCEGTAMLSQVEMTITTEYGASTFTVKRLLHNDGEKHPFFVFLNFRNNAPDYYYPVEEIVERGFGVLSFNYNDVTKDNGDFADGIAKLFLPNGQDKQDTCGKIVLWAWAASRVLDYAETLPCLDMDNAAVVGHSRLGKTALVAGLMDTRFQYTFSNDSGCGGASMARGSLGLLGIQGRYEMGQNIADITYKFPFWFCKRYCDFAQTNTPAGFDQHFLIAALAPRYAYVASAAMDEWADPDSEFRSCVAATEAYEKLGLPGLVHTGALPGDDITLHKGRIGYHRRRGKHFLSRVDWNRYMDYIDLHKNDK